MLVAVGTSLVAFGALLGLAAALLPRPDNDREGLVESEHRRRNLDVTTVASAFFLVAGGALLVSASWPWSLAALGSGVVLYYAALVAATHRDNRWLVKTVQIARDVDRQPDGKPGRVWVYTAVWLRMAPEDWLDANVAFYGDPNDPSSLTFADGLQRIAEERARLSWALRHPMGWGQTPLDIVKARLAHRRIVREARAPRE